MADNDDMKLPEKMCNPPVWLSLPSAWDWSLSNAENLRKMAYNINVIIQYLQDLQTNYEAYTDEKIAELKAYLDAADKEIYAYIDKLNAEMKSYVDAQDLAYWERHLQDITRLQTDIDNLRAYCDENFADIRNVHLQDVTKIYAQMQANYEQLISYCDRQIEQVQAWVNEQLDEIRLEVDEINEDGFRIDNPTTGERDHVGNTVTDVYNALRVHAVTCEEFDLWTEGHYGNTCDDFKMLFITALAFDVYSYVKMYQRYLETVNNPLTGEMTTHAVALENILNFSAEQALDCAERDGLELTCADISAKNENAYWWDTESVWYFNTEDAVVFKNAMGFVVWRKNVAWSFTPPEAPVPGNVSLYPSINGWHYLYTNFTPAFSKADNQSVTLLSPVAPRQYIANNNRRGVSITAEYTVTETNQAILTAFTSDVIDIASTFEEAYALLTVNLSINPAAMEGA